MWSVLEISPDDDKVSIEVFKAYVRSSKKYHKSVSGLCDDLVLEINCSVNNHLFSSVQFPRLT